MALWRLLVFAMWFGVAFAICTVIVAVALALIVGAVAMGILMPTRTVRGQLRTMAANASQAVASVKALQR